MKLVLTGGGTAGHVMPNIALLPHLRKTFDKIYYIGSHSGIERKIVAEQARGVEYFSVATVKLRRSIDLRNLAIPFKLFRGIAQAKKILKNLKADVVFSKGGFVAYPVVRAAAKLKIPVVAHESDMTMGLANRMSAKYARVICTTFKKIACQPRMVHTGSPLREEIYNGIGIKPEKRHGFAKEGKGNLLVFGGSLGAAKINDAVRGALDELAAKFNIVHICGKGKLSCQIPRHANACHPFILKGNYIELEFVNDIQNYFAWADVVVARAGSNSVCELLSLKKPTLFIPLSRANSRGDQIENANEIIKTNSAKVLWEHELTPKTLASGINELFKNRARYEKNASNIGNLDGTKKISEIIAKTALHS